MDQELEGTWFCESLAESSYLDQGQLTSDGDNLKRAVKEGKVSEKRLDDMVTRILIPWIAFGQKDKWNKPSYTRWGLADHEWWGDHRFTNRHEDNRREDYADFVRQAAEQSHV